MKLAWATDIHLNFLTTSARRRFLESVRQQADALVVTGAMAQSHSPNTALMVMDAVVSKPMARNHAECCGMVEAFVSQCLHAAHSRRPLWYRHGR